MLSITSSSARRETAQDNRNGQRRGVTEEIPCFSCKIFLKNGDTKITRKGVYKKILDI
jgi:alcohol dehydrogenase YqhD (iron-dependent ADH family)